MVILGDFRYPISDQYDEDCNLLLKKEALESSQRILCGQKKKTKKASWQRWYWSKHLRHIYLIGYYCKLFLLFSLNISNMVFKAIRNSQRSALGLSIQLLALCSIPALNIFSPRGKVSVLPEVLFAGLTKPTIFITKMDFL